MAITFLIPMVGKWNKNQLKAETSKLYYICLFIFQTFFLRPQNSFECDDWILRWRLQNLNRNWFNDLLNLLLGKHNCYGNDRNIRRNASENISWRFCRYFDFPASVFMHDGAPAQTSKIAIERLKDRSPEKLISLKS